jgi:hypothetical protein
MADNTALNAGSGGDTISTDDLGAGVKVQRVKCQYGADGSATDVDGTHPLPVRPGACATATPANVGSSTTSVTLFASNGSRLGAILVNDSTSMLYLKYGATASATSYTYAIEAGGTWEMPGPIYTGVIDGIWTSANGNARTTELT